MVMESWLTPLDKLQIIKAVQNKQTKVVVHQGAKSQLSQLSQLSQQYELSYIYPTRLCKHTVINGKRAEMGTLKIQRVPTHHTHYQSAFPLPLAYVEIALILDPNGEWFERDNG